jgi:4-amino-4-deoxy-L-arabinose transferase-like glycosyltransferase
MIMPVTDHVDSPLLTSQEIARERLRRWCRACVLAIVACQLWVGRYVIDADGTAYVDVARAWLRGDWVHALNPYWSPLYIWLLTAALGIFHPSMHWELPLIHAVNFIEFIAAFAAWEWLTSEWERWQGRPASPMLADVTGYCVVLWAGLRLTDLWWFNNADTLVMALLLAATAILIRVRRGVSTNRDFLLLGVMLGTGFLAKTAFLAVIPAFLVVLALLLRSWPQSWIDQRVLATALMACAIAAPFVAAISIANHRFTVGDSGRLNYSWHVTGMSVEGYKENAYWPGPESPHPIRVLMQHPRVLSFDQHVVGTYPIHADISWWCEGYPVRFDKARQLMILWSDILFSIYAFRCPALFLLLLGLVYGASEVAKRLAQTWFIWAPALFFALTYCFVYSDYRYLAGSYALIGFALIAAVWHVAVPPLAARISILAIPVLTCVLLMGGSFRHMLPQLILDTAGRRAPWAYLDVEVAETMRRQGLQPGDRVAYIGFELGAAHVGVERAHIVAVIPERVTHDDKIWGRPYVFTFPKQDEFWRSSEQTKQQVFEVFRSVGAKWVFADTVPKWADVTGWQVAGGSPGIREIDRPYTYFRKLQ